MGLSKDDILQEEKHLDYALSVIRRKLSQMGQELYDKQEKIQEFQKFIWDSRHDMDPTEMKTLMTSSDLEVEMATRRAKYFQKLFKIQNNPYFGAITFDDGKDCNKIYIGITYLEDEEKDNYIIHDWRAPISSMFYDYEVGKAKYDSPSGEIKGEIKNKRQFKIEYGKLIRVFDNNLNIDDDILQEVLSTNSSEKMKNIVNTIQQEQNEIIRNIVDKNLIVQGIAGSGKTSVALHRIAFLLYKIENLNSNNVLIFSPNQVFSEYISNVLPELGEDNTMQTTFHDFLSSFIKEYKYVESFTSFVERYYKYKEKNKELVKYKQSDQIIEDLDKYVSNIMRNIEFTNGIEIHDFSISKEDLNYLLKDRYSRFNLYERIEEICEKLCRDYYKGKHTKKSTIRSILYKLLNIKFDYKEIFREFFRSKYFNESYKGTITEEEIKNMTNKKYLNYEDACIFVYLKSLLEGFGYKGLIKEVVIDEAQDYNKLQYLIIRKIFKKSSFTILGDINQTVNPYYKYKSLETLKEIFDDTRYIELTKTYRSSEEIIEYTNKILNLGHVSAIRNSNKREVLFREESNNIVELLEKDIDDMKKANFSLAIITKDDDEAEYIYDLLKDKHGDLSLLNSNSVEFSKRFIVVPAYIAKGLEFDSTIIYTFKDNKYKEEEKNLFYVACTRSQHQLIVYNQ